MPLPDTIYCAQQINTPPELYDILKNFTKAAIRAQPADLLDWSQGYFRELSQEQTSSDKDNQEENVPSQERDLVLTAELLKALHEQFSSNDTCSKVELEEKWEGMGLTMEQLQTLLSLGSFEDEINWMDFFAVGCSALEETIQGSLKLACELLTNEEEGEASILFDTFSRLYTYLMQLGGDTSQEDIDNFLSSLQQQAEEQDGMIKPLDFLQRDDMDTPRSDASAEMPLKAESD